MAVCYARVFLFATDHILKGEYEMQSYYLTSEEVLKNQEVTENGLSHEEAKVRQEKFGKNKLDEGKKTPLIVRFLKELADPMTIILLVAATVSGISGESLADVFIILAVVLINAVLGVVQESKADKAIEALQEMCPPRPQKCSEMGRKWW